jgi:hypothetical protein
MGDARWWRLQSDRKFAIEATMRDAQVELTVVDAISKCPQAQALCAVEARYYGIDRPEFGGHGQIQRVATQFQLDVLTDAPLSASWIPLTGIGETTHPPDAYGPGSMLAVWRPGGRASPAHEEKRYPPRTGTTRR